MEKLIQFSEKDIGRFKEMGILAIYLFGSMAAGKYIHSLSDYDFGVILENFEKLKDELGVYEELYDIIIEKLPQKYLKKRFALKAHEVDIVFLQNAPVGLQFEAINSGKVLYESDAEKRLDYEEYVVKRQCDLEYFHKMQRTAILERI